jgi:hypothetical protein
MKPERRNMMESGMALLRRLAYLILSGLISSAYFSYIWYRSTVTHDISLSCSIQIGCLVFIFALIVLLPCYILSHRLFAFARKWWVASLIGVLWYPLQSICLILFNKPSSGIMAFFGLVLTTIVDCALIVAGSWGIAKLQQGADRQSDNGG